MNELVKHIRKLDHTINQIIEEHQHPLAIQSFQSITSLGSIQLNLVFLALLLSFQQINVAEELVIGFAVTWALIYPVKELVKRNRPDKKKSHIMYGGSFPSGHSGTAFVTATILANNFNREEIFLTLATLVAFSRIYLEDHYPSDAIAGSLIGLIVGITVTGI